MSSVVRHFLDIHSYNLQELRDILRLARDGKAILKLNDSHQPLAGKTLAMIFEKPSTRTRVSFQVGVQQLGGQAILIESEQSQLGRGESVADTARVLSRYVDMVMIRCYDHEDLLAFAEHASVPVINGLTNESHPCQVMADILTIEEHLHDDIADKVIAWVGDGNNNMVRSWIHAAARFGFAFHITCPEAYKPDDAMLQWAKQEGADVLVSCDPADIVTNADVVNTDCWVSMGDKDVEERKALLQPYQVNSALMEMAKPNALFMHCLPAHRGEEVTDNVIDGSQSVVFDQAENRLHVQKGIMEWLVNA